MRLPSLRRRRALEPIRFEPVERVFRPQVRIRMRNDVSGWIGPKRERRRFALAAGRTYAIDEERAREFVAKGYAEFLDPQRRPLSDDERAEYEAQVTRIELGGAGRG